MERVVSLRGVGLHERRTSSRDDRLVLGRGERAIRPFDRAFEQPSVAFALPGFVQGGNPGERVGEIQR